MKHHSWTPKQLILCRSDTGDGGWSLHAPWATDEQIADGREPPLLSDIAVGDDFGWNGPTELDREQAMNILATRDNCRA